MNDEIKTVGEIDITPTWGEWGNLYRHLAESGEHRACRALHADYAKAMAAAEALKQIQKELPDHLQKKVSFVLTEELTKQGY